jgi:hypothetical protein
LEIQTDGPPAWVELKWAKQVGTLHNCLWDAAKLACAVRDGVASVGYLVAGAPAEEWAKQSPYTRLFGFSSHSGDSIAADYEPSFRGWLAENENTYPKILATPVCTAPVGEVDQVDAGGTSWVVRVARVFSHGSQTFEAPRFGL